jgi:transcriptional regulator with XRE-family HTH domain
MPPVVARSGKSRAVLRAFEVKNCPREWTALVWQVDAVAADQLMLVARNVRRLRSVSGYSQSELARRAGLAKQTLSSIEAGDANPTVVTLAAIAEALGIPLSATSGRAHGDYYPAGRKSACAYADPPNAREGISAFECVRYIRRPTGRAARWQRTTSTHCRRK